MVTSGTQLSVTYYIDKGDKETVENEITRRMGKIGGIPKKPVQFDPDVGSMFLLTCTFEFTNKWTLNTPRFENLYKDLLRLVEVKFG